MELPLYAVYNPRRQQVSKPVQFQCALVSGESAAETVLMLQVAFMEKNFKTQVHEWYSRFRVGDVM
jgi:hypothetical protein